MYKNGLKAEHGLSILIKTDNHHILFDTGQTGLFMDNAQTMGEDLMKVNMVVISHGHYDHTGGLERFLKFNPHAMVFLKQEATHKKFSSSTGLVRSIGFPFDVTPYQERVRFITENTEIAPGIFLLTGIERNTSFETLHPKLMISATKGFMTDPFDDELVMYLHHNKGAVIVSGCAHRGLINTLNTVTKHTKSDLIRLFIGGTHLNGTHDHRLESTLQTLSKMKITQMMLNHCTGIQAYAQVSKRQTNVSYASTGTVVTL